MEELKSENDEVIILRFTEKLEIDIYQNKYSLKRNFISGNDLSRDFTFEEINQINKIICLGNKITKGYEDQENNSGNQYNSNAKIIFEPGKDYKITKSEFEKLKKVFVFESNFLQVNKKIEFEFVDSRKIKMRPYAKLSENSVVKKLLKDNSIKINEDTDGKKTISFEARKKYYFTPKDIKLLNGIFAIEQTYQDLRSDCIHKNIFDMPLDILQSFINGYRNLNYQKYIFDERAKKNSETQKNGISDNLWSQLVDIKTKYKEARKIIGANKSVEEIKNVINRWGFDKIESENRLVEIFTEPAKLDEYFINETLNKINKTIKECGFTEIKSENQLANTLLSSLKTGSLNSENINLILIKIKDSLNETILQEALNVLIKNMSKGYLVNTKLLNTLETFLFSDGAICLDDLKEILFGKTVKTGDPNEPQRQINGLIDNKKADYVLEYLKKLKNDKESVYKAIGTMLKNYSFSQTNLQIDDKFKIALENILSKKSSSLSHEHIITILKAVAKLESSENESTSNINCVLEAVEKYKLDIEDKNPLKNIMRLFFNPDKIDKINLHAISDKINDTLTEQIYTEMLQKRPALLFFVDIDFLYKKIIVDPNDNVFKETFYGISRHVGDDANRFSIQNEKINALYFNLLLNRISQNSEYNSDLYCYDFISFIANNIKKFNKPSVMLVLFCALISRLDPDFLYTKIFSGEGEKNPIKNLLGMLFENGQPSYFAKNDLVTKEFVDNSETIAMEKYNVFNSGCWVIIAHILSNLKYKPEYKDNFLYFFDLFKWNTHDMKDDDYDDLLKLFDFVDSGFLFGNLDVIERYLTCYGKNNILCQYLAGNTIGQICDYDNYLKYAAEPKLHETEYFYTLLNYYNGCIEYIKPKFIFDHLKDADMKRYYQWIRDNNESKVNDMYEYVKGKKYDNLEQQKEDILLLIEIFPDAMAKYIDAEFLIDNWNTLDSNFQNECVLSDNFIDGLAKINDIKKKEEWYLYLLQLYPRGYFHNANVTNFFANNFDKFSDKTVNECVGLFKKNNVTESLLPSLFDKVNNLDLEKGERIYCPQKAEKTLWLIETFGPQQASKHVDKKFLIENLNDEYIGDTVKKCIKLCAIEDDDEFCKSLYNVVMNEPLYRNCEDKDKSKPKAEKTLWFIKTFGPQQASKHVDKKFLIKNLNDEDIGDTVKECIKLCATDDEFCKSLCNVVMDEQLYRNFVDQEKQVQQRKIILDLIDIGKEKIFEHVDNRFLLENLDNEMIKELINYASETKINSMFESINDLNYNDEAKIDLYFKLIKYRPDLLNVLRSWYFNSNTNFIQALNKSILDKNISVLSFLNNYHSENQKWNVFYFIWNLMHMKPCDTKTQLIYAIACLDSFELQNISNISYTYRNCAYLKFHVNNNNFSFYYPMNNRKIARLAENLFKIYNQQNCNLNLIDLVSENHRLCCETIDSYLPEYHELSGIIQSSYKKSLWFIGISSFILLAIFISCFWIEILVIYFVHYISFILFCLLMLDLINAVINEGFTVFKKIFLPLILKKYETRIKREKEARHGFYQFLNDQFDFKNHVGVYDETLKSITDKNIDVKKDFFDWLKTNKKDENFNKENNREEKIGFVVDFILHAPNNKIMKKLDGEIEKLKDYSNDESTRNLIDAWLSENQGYNNCRDVLRSEFLDMIKFKDGELKIKLKIELKRKDNINTLAEKICDQIINPQNKNLDLQNKKENKEEEINTSEKNIINNDNQLENGNFIPQSEDQKENQI